MRIPLLTVSLAVALLARTANAFTVHPTRACGRELWDLKTLSDPRRNLVYLQPVPTTVAAINAKRPPRKIGRLRSRGFERHVWRVTAEITEYKLEADGDIHMVLFDEGAYMIAEMPARECLPHTTRDRRAIVNARNAFESRCGAATDIWQPLGAVAEIDGVGFWDNPHGQRGQARTAAELHPVTKFRIVSGCA